MKNFMIILAIAPILNIGAVYAQPCMDATNLELQRLHMGTFEQPAVDTNKQVLGVEDKAGNFIEVEYTFQAGLNYVNYFTGKDDSVVWARPGLNGDFDSGVQIVLDNKTCTVKSASMLHSIDPGGHSYVGVNGSDVYGFSCASSEQLTDNQKLLCSRYFAK